MQVTWTDTNGNDKWGVLATPSGSRRFRLAYIRGRFRITWHDDTRGLVSGVNVFTDPTDASKGYSCPEAKAIWRAQLDL